MSNNLLKELVREHTFITQKGCAEEHLVSRSGIARLLTERGDSRLDQEMRANVHRAELVRSKLIEQLKMPSLEEVITATEKLDNCSRMISAKLRPRVRTIIQLGSFGWAKYYWVHGTGRRPSDLDMEVLIDDIDPSVGSGFPGAEKGLEAFRKHYNMGEADYFSYGYRWGSQKISIHFMPTDTFLRNCNFNFRNLRGPVENREFRTLPKLKPPIYAERYDGQGNEFVYVARPERCEDGILTKVPVMMIGDQEQIVMGLVMSKYFAHPNVEGDQEIFERSIVKFKAQLALRLADEGGGQFSNMPARKCRMPLYTIEKLDREQQTLGAQFAA